MPYKVESLFSLACTVCERSLVSTESLGLFSQYVMAALIKRFLTEVQLWILGKMTLSMIIVYKSLFSVYSVPHCSGPE